MKQFYYRSVPGFLLSLALIFTACAADNAPTVDSILDKFVEASGGKGALE